MEPFAGLDYYRLDELYSDEERLIRETVRTFVDAEVLPIIEAHHRQGTFPLHLIPRLGELGLLGANLRGYGCAGVSEVAYGLIMQELERGDSGLRSFASVQGALAMYPIYAFGTEAQQKDWLPRLARGEKVGCFGLTEPDHGSDPAGMVTKAVRRGDGYVLNGSKLWITNGTIADVAVVWARTEEGIRGFLVEKGTPGFSAREIHGKFSLRASITSELIFQDCRIPSASLLPGSEQGLRAALMCLDQARYGIAWGAVGAAAACYDAALKYAKARVQFDRPIAGFQLVQQKLVRMLTEITKAQLLCHRLGQLKEAGQARHTQISLAKMNNVENAREIARLAREILGAAGIVDEYPVIRHMLNLETLYTYEGTHEIHTLILGRDITGLSAFA
ncbi:MAG: acyl-CoA dehydrogenase family protein [candidate division NC10 bacterium]|nr:acyl-CoA dehydrogenase family protein [candidate division NC10 bacterium]